YKEAADLALRSYLEGVEPVENSIRAIEPPLVGEIENNMNNLRSAIAKKASYEEIEALAAKSQVALQKADALLQSQEYSFSFVALLSGSILLREGLEAFLVIITILSVLKAAKAPQAAKWVHAGWITALALGIMSWFFVDALLNIGIKERELLEGFAGLFACAVLLYVGFWLHSKAEISKWKDFIQNKIHKVLKSNNLIGLAVLSFVVVFREAFESVIFLSSLKLEVSPENEPGIWVGMAVATGLIAVIGWQMMKYSRKIPIRELFKYSAYMMSFLAIILVGKGIHSLQEADWVSVTGLPVLLRFEWIGLYPTYETFMAQVLTLILIVVLWRIANKPMESKTDTKTAKQEEVASEQEA
ncbi:MAG: FTR1 family protein, partial [Bernardetiaceae bacterium]|nr:FTR1 family protein [Bernardetiaceae bacterium]